MSNYRRAAAPGGCFFFTVVTFGRRPILGDPAVFERLRGAFRKVIAERPFEIDAMVVLPDHLHCIWRLPREDADFSTRWRVIKQHVSSGMDAAVNARGEKQVWQRRFWEHLIRDEEDWRRHMDYVHYNPVKHGYVKRPVDWRFGTFRRAVEKGWYDENWGAFAPRSIEGLALE